MGSPSATTGRSVESGREPTHDVGLASVIPRSLRVARSWAASAEFADARLRRSVATSAGAVSGRAGSTTFASAESAEKPCISSYISWKKSDGSSSSRDVAVTSKSAVARDVAT